MLNFFNKKKKAPSKELNKKLIESGKTRKRLIIIQIILFFKIYRNRIIIRF
jgi:hypothetical protein